MDFSNHLFGHKVKTDEQNISNSKFTDIEIELKSFCNENSHPEYPLLRNNYSPMSRYPVVDFTPWIIKKLKEKRFDDIAYLIIKLTSANPGLGISSAYWGNIVADICKINLREYIVCEDDKGIFDLHAALLIYVLQGSLDGFILKNSGVDFLARTMSPYVFSICNLESKIGLANQFIKKMRRETKNCSMAWTDYHTFREDAFKEVLNLTPPVSKLRNTLREVSIGARQLFFGTLLNGPGQGHWMAVPSGIDEQKVSEELVNIGLGELKNDPLLVLLSYRKEELISVLINHQIKQGWNKKYLIKYMLENVPEIVFKLSKDKKVFVMQEKIIEDGKVLEEYINKTKVCLAIALGFKEK